MACRIIAIVNQKGGTGKTTTTLNLGAALAGLGKSVLLVDLDPQSNLSFTLGCIGSKPGIAEVFQNQYLIEDAAVEREKMYVLPGSTEMADVELNLVNQTNRESVLKELLLQVTEEVDFILIDAPPSLSLLTLNALVAAKEVIIPLQMEVLTFQGLQQIVDTVNKVKATLNPALKITGILRTMYDRRKKLTEELNQYLPVNFNQHVFKTPIRTNVKVAESPSFGQSVINYAPSSNGSKDYQQLAAELLKLKTGAAVQPTYI